MFVAVEVPDRVRRELDEALEPLRARFERLRWTPAEDWHVTLAFLGDTPGERLAPAEQAVRRAASQVAPFQLALDGGAGRFGKRVLWAGLQPSPALDALEVATAAALRAAGFTLEDRPFHAHLTLARSRRGFPLRAGMEEAFSGPTPDWSVSRVVLMRSQSGEEGPHYQLQAQAPLGGDVSGGDAGDGSANGSARDA